MTGWRLNIFRACEAATGHAPPLPLRVSWLLNSRESNQVHGRPGESLLVSSLPFFFFFGFQVSTRQDVSTRVPSALHGAGGGLPLHQGVLLGAAGDPGLRRDRLLADASGRRGAHPPPGWQRREPVSGRTPAQALGERPALDGAVLHRGAGDAPRARRRTGERGYLLAPSHLALHRHRRSFIGRFHRVGVGVGVGGCCACAEASVGTCFRGVSPVGEDARKPAGIFHPRTLRTSSVTWKLRGRFSEWARGQGPGRGLRRAHTAREERTGDKVDLWGWGGGSGVNE